MFGLKEEISEWLRGMLIDGITANFTGLFDAVNEKAGEIAGQVGQTPQGFNGGVFAMIRNLSDTVIVPIAGIILTLVLCYELITMVMEKNNMAEAVCCKGRYSNAT